MHRKGSLISQLFTFLTTERPDWTYTAGEEPSSPIARIKGGLGMNEKGEVLIFDGVDTIYGVPFLSMDETYANGKEFLNGEGLTDEQKAAYHCD